MISITSSRSLSYLSFQAFNGNHHIIMIVVIIVINIMPRCISAFIESGRVSAQCTD